MFQVLIDDMLKDRGNGIVLFSEIGKLVQNYHCPAVELVCQIIENIVQVIALDGRFIKEPGHVPFEAGRVSPGPRPVAQEIEAFPTFHEFLDERGLTDSPSTVDDNELESVGVVPLPEFGEFCLSSDEV